MIEQYIFEFLIAILAGFFGAVAGGGGLITLPFIMLLGVPALTSIGTNKMLACLTTTSSASVFIRKGLFEISKWKYCLIFTVFGSIVGVTTIRKIPPHILEKYLPYLIIAVCLYAIFKKNNNACDNRFYGDLHKISTSVFGFVLGFYGGFIGAGIGMFWTSLMMARYKVNIVNATAISRAMCFIGNTTSFVLFAFFGHVNYKTGLIMGMAMAIGSFLGAHMAIKFGQKFIKIVLCIICILMCAQLILNR